MLNEQVSVKNYAQCAKNKLKYKDKSVWAVLNEQVSVKNSAQWPRCVEKESVTKDSVLSAAALGQGLLRNDPYLRQIFLLDQPLRDFPWQKSIGQANDPSWESLDSIC